jgi:hypothetical protein
MEALLKNISTIPTGLYKSFSTYALDTITDAHYSVHEIKVIEKFKVTRDPDFSSCAELEGFLGIAYNKDGAAWIDFYEFDDEIYTQIYSGTIGDFARDRRCLRVVF